MLNVKPIKRVVDRLTRPLRRVKAVLAGPRMVIEVANLAGLRSRLRDATAAASAEREG